MATNLEIEMRWIDAWSDLTKSFIQPYRNLSWTSYISDIDNASDKHSPVP
jgi:hypothetical protein